MCSDAPELRIDRRTDNAKATPRAICTVGVHGSPQREKCREEMMALRLNFPNTIVPASYFEVTACQASFSSSHYRVLAAGARWP
jgi:hypothetical protein